MESIFLFVGILVLAGFVTFYAFRSKNLLAVLASSVCWLGLGLWAFIGENPLISLETPHGKILVWVFFILVFVPVLAQISTEVRREIKRSDGTRWYWFENTTSPPASKLKGSEQVRYRRELRERLERARRRR